MKNIKVKVQLDPGAQLPTRALNGDTGYDIRAMKVAFREYNDITGEWLTLDEWRAVSEHVRHNPWQVVIDTGVHLQPEQGWAFEGRPNSRNGKSMFRWAFSPGTIDGNYTGSIKVILEPRFHWVHPKYAPKPGEVCGQLILEEVHNADFELTDKLDETDRGDGGFGSTEEKKCGNCKYFSEEHIHGSTFHQSCIFNKQEKITEETTACPSFNN